MKAVARLVGFALFFVSVVVYADMPKGQYLEAKNSAVISWLKQRESAK